MAKKVSRSAARKAIVVLQRGWVVIGDLSKRGDEYRLKKASVIRIWGTTKGLGEIALAGPTSKTVLDPAGTIRFHELTTVAILDVDASKWQA